MALLVAIEGLDGAGKNTLTRAVTERLAADGLRVGALAFPRYGTVYADQAALALRGEQGDALDSVYGMALLFAFDRRDAIGEIDRLRREHDVVLLDRYAASSAAYSAARMREGADGEVASWVLRKEFGEFALPRPDLQVYLRVPTALAADRARWREASDARRTRDAYERDADLQARTGTAYEQLAAMGWAGRWRVHEVNDSPAQLARAIIARLGY